MKCKRFTEEQIIGVLKEGEAGAKTDDICQRHGISSATFYSWCNKYGGTDASEVKRLRELEAWTQAESIANKLRVFVGCLPCKRAVLRPDNKWEPR